MEGPNMSCAKGDSSEAGIHGSAQETSENDQVPGIELRQLGETHVWEIMGRGSMRNESWSMYQV